MDGSFRIRAHDRSKSRSCGSLRWQSAPFPRAGAICLHVGNGPGSPIPAAKNEYVPVRAGRKDRGGTLTTVGHGASSRPHVFHGVINLDGVGAKHLIVGAAYRIDAPIRAQSSSKSMSGRRHVRSSAPCAGNGIIGFDGTHSVVGYGMRSVAAVRAIPAPDGMNARSADTRSIGTRTPPSSKTKSAWDYMPFGTAR